MSPLRRRQLLSAAVVGLSLSLGGCLGVSAPTRNTPEKQSNPSSEQDTVRIPKKPPAYDCETASRPSSTPLSETSYEDALQPRAYPTEVPTLSNGEAVVEYVEAYERAHRQNALLERYWPHLVHYSLSVETTKTYESTEGSAVVRLEYFETYTEKESDQYIIADSPRLFVTYYVDENAVIRAESGGPRDDEDALDPNPWKNGVVLECFE